MTSNRKAALDGLAFEARRNWRLSVEHWLASAAAVAEARDLCEHGEWGPWLRKTAIPETTSRRMLTIAKAGIKSATVADMGGIARTAELLAENPGRDDRRPRRGGRADGLCDGEDGCSADTRLQRQRRVADSERDACRDAAYRRRGRSLARMGRGYRRRERDRRPRPDRRDL